MFFRDTFKSTRFFGENHPGKKKTPNRHKDDDNNNNNIMIPSFYKNVIFTSLSETSLLSSYTVQGNNNNNNKRNERVCLRHTVLAKASVKQNLNKTLRLWLVLLFIFFIFSVPYIHLSFGLTARTEERGRGNAEYAQRGEERSIWNSI